MYHRTTYGVLPTETEFKLLCNIPDEDGHVVAKDGFKFGNCKRMGNCTLTVDQLYKELVKAHKEFEEGENSPRGYDEGEGSWIASVLYVLGWEWV